MLSSYDPTIDACWMGEASELYDVRLEGENAGIWGVEVIVDRFGAEVRDRRG